MCKRLIKFDVTISVVIKAKSVVRCIFRSKIPKEMASGEQEKDVQCQLNEALEYRETNKRLLRQLFKQKIFNDEDGVDFHITKTMEKLNKNEDMIKELRKQSEIEQKKGRNA